MVDPFSISAKVLEDTLANWQSAVPSEGAISGVVSAVFAGLTRDSGSPASIASSVEALFSGVEGVVSGMQASVDTVLGNFAPIAATLSAHFDALETRPADGD